MEDMHIEDTEQIKLNPSLLIPHQKADRLSDTIADSIDTKSKPRKKKLTSIERKLQLRATPDEYHPLSASHALYWTAARKGHTCPATITFWIRILLASTQRLNQEGS